MTKKISGQVLFSEDVEVIHGMTQLPESILNGAIKTTGTTKVYAIMDDSPCLALLKKNVAKCVLVYKGEVFLIHPGWVLSGVTLDLR